MSSDNPGVDIVSKFRAVLDNAENNMVDSKNNISKKNFLSIIKYL